MNSDEVQRQHKLLIIVGPSGVGKSTFINHIITKFPNAFCFSASHTTRKMRSGEVDGVDYNFTSEEEFNKLVESEDFIEYGCYSEHFYGTSKTQLKKIQNGTKICILDIDIRGAKKIFESGIESNFVSVLPPSFEDLRLRLLARNKDSLEVINNRLEISKVEIEDIQNSDFFNYKIINDDIDGAIKKLELFLVEFYPHLF